MSPGSASRSPPPWIQPSLRAARRSAGSAWPPTMIGIGRGRHRALLDARDVVDLAVVLEPVAGEEPPHDGDALVGPLAAPLERDVAHLVVLRPRAGAHAERQAVVRQHSGGRGLLGDEHRMAHGELEHRDHEADAVGDRAHRRDDRERLEERLVLDEAPVAVSGVRVDRLGLGRVADAVGDQEPVEARRLRGLREREVVAGVGHRLRVGEPHPAPRPGVSKTTVVPQGSVTATSRMPHGWSTGITPSRSASSSKRSGTAQASCEADGGPRRRRTLAAFGREAGRHDRGADRRVPDQPLDPEAQLVSPPRGGGGHVGHREHRRDPHHLGRQRHRALDRVHVDPARRLELQVEAPEGAPVVSAEPLGHPL